MRSFLAAVLAAFTLTACTPQPACVVCCIVRDGDTVREVPCP